MNMNRFLACPIFDYNIFFLQSFSTRPTQLLFLKWHHVATHWKWNSTIPIKHTHCVILFTLLWMINCRNVGKIKILVTRMIDIAIIKNLKTFVAKRDIFLLIFNLLAFLCNLNSIFYSHIVVRSTCSSQVCRKEIVLSESLLIEIFRFLGFEIKWKPRVAWVLFLIQNIRRTKFQSLLAVRYSTKVTVNDMLKNGRLVVWTKIKIWHFIIYSWNYACFKDLKTMSLLNLRLSGF